MADRCTVCFTYRAGVEIHWMWSCFPLGMARCFFVARWVVVGMAEAAGSLTLGGAVERERETEPHPPLFHKHFGMEHLKFKSYNITYQVL